MKAFQYAEAATGLQLKELPVPEPGPDEVLIKIRAAGMCHTDCHIIEGTSDDWIKKRPITLGHEVAGEVVKAGANVADLFGRGDRVAVCQVCQPYAKRDWLKSIGLGFDGGYAEYSAVPASRLKRIPDNVSFAQAAVAMDALATSYEAIMVGGVKKGSTVGIVGIGGLGMSGVAFAAIEGAEVYGFDLDTSKFEEAKALGARACFKSLPEAEGVAFDMILDFVGIEKTIGAACSSVKPTGTVVVIGLASTSVSVPIQKMLFNSITLKGSMGASEETAERVLELLEKGSIKPSLVEVPFQAIPSTLKRLADGAKTEGRYWTDPSKAA
ncbi:alcohol dehydrogenase GroES-like domain-containing protein [Diaporthe helianthi]|uniref:Alcohol dehydrogenase GroES-like domain-containing protein n=1 Tax=Diaporthe helianthi TaxID=158607 RepID=A0A2P5IBV2_DIAHE|nr:alcohol dehydrogenase GroES-like domain-containing protein [Diaporthe helianthi]